MQHEAEEAVINHIDTSLPWRDSSASQANEARLEGIGHLCAVHDLPKLRQIARSGLVHDGARKLVWPLLLGITKEQAEKQSDWRQLARHRDEDQVGLDVDRSFIHYPNDRSTKKLDRRKAELSDLITEVLRRNPELCYFQGYHDIAQVFLLVLGPNLAVPALTYLSILRIRDFMLSSMSPALLHLRLLPSLLNSKNPKLSKHLALTQPFFALAATLTLYAHEIQEYGDIARLFDAFLSREAVYPIYVFAQIVLTRQDELFEIPADEPDILYAVLSKLPKPLDLNSLLKQSDRLYDETPPSSLRGWSSISRHSVLKTALDLDEVASESLEDGRISFRKQAAELRRAEKIQVVKKMAWRYRRPVGSVGLAVLVGLVSWYVRRNGASIWISGSEWHLEDGWRQLYSTWNRI